MPIPEREVSSCLAMPVWEVFAMVEFTRGSQSNAIDVRLAAESIECNRSIGFRLIESIERLNFPNFFVIDSMSVRLPFD